MPGTAPGCYSYAYPEPDGFADQPIGPEGAFFSAEFLHITYAAAADRGDWDRPALEDTLQMAPNQSGERHMITVTDNRTANRFEARDGETLAGFATCLRTSELVAFLHTEVDPPGITGLSSGAP